MSTLLGECDRKFREVVLGVDLGSSHAQHSSVVLLTDTLTNFNHRLDFFKKAVCFLAGRFDPGSDFVSELSDWISFATWDPCSWCHVCRVGPFSSWLD